MEYIIYWLATIGISVVMDTTNSLRIFKDVADAGYKINMKEFPNLNSINNDDSSNKKMTILLRLIPIVNLLLPMANAIKYNNEREIFLEELNVLGLLDKMDEQEKNEYDKKKTLLNALLICSRENKILEDAIHLTLEDGSMIIYDDSQIEIFSSKDKNPASINILKVTGPASLLSSAQQKQLVLKELDEIYQLIMEEAEKEVEKIVTNPNDASKEDMDFVRLFIADTIKNSEEEENIKEEENKIKVTVKKRTLRK